MAQRSLGALVLRRPANFAWYTGGADSRVDHVAPTGMADIVATERTSSIEAPRMRGEQTPELEVVDVPVAREPGQGAARPGRRRAGRCRPAARRRGRRRGCSAGRKTDARCPRETRFPLAAMQDRRPDGRRDRGRSPCTRRAGVSQADGQETNGAAVYTFSNSSAGDAVLKFERGRYGSFTAAGSTASGGLGTGGGRGSQGR